MEGNKEEALRCLSIAQRHRNSSNLSAALRFARKSVSLYATSEGEKMVVVLEEEISVGGETSARGAGANGNGDAGGSSKSSSAPGSTPGTPGGRSTGVEEHVTSARQRHTAASSAASAKDEVKKTKTTYTSKQIEVVSRVKRCRHYAYYEILSVEKTCSDSEVKRAYKKLALALHPDKNSAPGADEAFKMVSKAFQVLSDKNLREVYDMNPTVDPTQRGGGGGGGGGFPGGGGMRFRTHPGFHGGGGGQFQGEINPEDLFNMFFGGGGMDPGGFGGPFGGARVYTFGGPRRRRPAGAAGHAPDGVDMTGGGSPLMAFLPILLLALFVIFSLIPTLFGDDTPDPGFTFERTNRYNTERHTLHRKVPYFVNQAEFEGSKIWQDVPEQYRARKDAAQFSSRLKSYEFGVEQSQIHRLQQQCRAFDSARHRKIAEEAGVFGWGADYDKIRELRQKTHPSCEQLRKWGVSTLAY